MLTKKQRMLVELIERRAWLQFPTIQRDLAEEMGVSRAALSRLLGRTRAALAAQGRSLILPRPKSAVVKLVSLPDDI